MPSPGVFGIGIVQFRPKAVSGFENPRIVGSDGGSVLSASLTVSLSLTEDTRRLWLDRAERLPGCSLVASAAEDGTLSAGSETLGRTTLYLDVGCGLLELKGIHVDLADSMMTAFDGWEGFSVNPSAATEVCIRAKAIRGLSWDSGRRKGIQTCQRSFRGTPRA